MKAVRRILWRLFAEPVALTFSRRTFQLLGSSAAIWGAARELFQSVLAGTRTPVTTPDSEDWKLRTVVYGFGNVVTTCRGSPAAIDPAQLQDHWNKVRAHFAPFDDLLQLVARLRALAQVLLYPGSLLFTGLYYDEILLLGKIFALLVVLWLLLQVGLPALVRWRLRAI